MAGGTIEGKFKEWISWAIYIGTLVLGLAASWYGAEVRAAVQEERFTQSERRQEEKNEQIERRVEVLEELARQYPQLQIEVNGRLSRIEGALGVRSK